MFKLWMYDLIDTAASIFTINIWFRLKGISCEYYQRWHQLDW